MAHFIPMLGTPSAMETARTFIKQVVRLNGVPDSITSDRGVQFTLRFWKDLFRTLKIQTCFFFQLIILRRMAKLNERTRPWSNTIDAFRLLLKMTGHPFYPWQNLFTQCNSFGYRTSPVFCKLWVLPSRFTQHLARFPGSYSPGKHNISAVKQQGVARYHLQSTTGQ